mgnify:FL=1
MDFSKVFSPSLDDPLLFTGIQNDWTLNSDFGIAYLYKDLKVGLVGRQLLGTEYKYENVLEEKYGTISSLFQFEAHASYRYELKEEVFYLDPLVQLRSVQGLPMIFDAQLNFNYKDQAWIGGMYRNNGSIALNIGFVPFEPLRVNYSYEISSSALSSNFGNTHEFMMVYQLRKTKSVEDSKSQRKVERLLRQNREQFQAIEELRSRNDKLRVDLDSAQAKIKEILELREQYKNYEDQLNSDRRKAGGVTEDNFLNEVNKMKIKVDEHGDRIEDLRDRAGFHDDSSQVESPEEGFFYVVVGSFPDYASARKHHNTIIRYTEIESEIVQSSDGKWFYVYTDKVESMDEGHKNAMELKKHGIDRFIIGDIWYYKK